MRRGHALLPVLVATATAGVMGGCGERGSLADSERVPAVARSPRLAAVGLDKTLHNPSNDDPLPYLCPEFDQSLFSIAVVRGPAEYTATVTRTGERWRVTVRFGDESASSESGYLVRRIGSGYCVVELDDQHR